MLVVVAYLPMAVSLLEKAHGGTWRSFREAAEIYLTYYASEQCQDYYKGSLMCAEIDVPRIQ